MDFEYAKVTDHYFVSIGLNPIRYSWYLITKRKILPAVFGRRLIVKLLKAKFYRKHEMNLLRMPVNGTWCRRLRTGGFKVFDIPRGIVTRVYDPETDKEVIEKQIDLFTRVGHLEFAPALTCWSVDEGWYEEDFFEGMSGNGFIPIDAPQIAMDRYVSQIEPLLGKMILAEQPKPTPLMIYLEEFENLRWTMIEVTGDENVSNFLVFIEKMVRRCRELILNPATKIYLVLSHGDFHQFNMIWTGSGLKLIDWDGTQKRSLLFDFYNFFFSQLYLKNTSLEYPKEIKKGVHQLSLRIAKNSPQLSKNIIECAELYRLVYYIERIHSFITSFGLDSQRITRWVDAFLSFEENIKGR